MFTVGFQSFKPPKLSSYATKFVKIIFLWAIAFFDFHVILLTEGWNSGVRSPFGNQNGNVQELIQIQTATGNRAGY